MRFLGLLVVAGFTTFFPLNPPRTIFVQTNYINRTADIARAFDRLDSDQAVEKHNRIRPDEKRLVNLIQSLNRVFETKWNDRASLTAWEDPRWINSWNRAGSINDIANLEIVKSPISVFTCKEPNSSEASWRTAAAIVSEKGVRPCRIKSPDRLKNTITWKLSHGVHEYLGDLAKRFIEYADILYADDSISTRHNLADSIHRFLPVGDASAICSQVCDSIADHKNNSRSTHCLTLRELQEKHGGPNYFRQLYDPELEHVFDCDDDGHTWLIYGADIDVSWDRKTWYHLLGWRCLKGCRRLTIQKPE